MSLNNEQQPFIPANVQLPEFTLKAIILGIILTILLAASNAYLALKVGTTVAASIPAAVISLAIFSLFKKSNILESNLVQTAASAGEGLAAAATFIIPALLIVHFWHEFNFWQSVAILLVGGLLGVLFSVPLRRVLLNQPNLPFPEGTAVGNVLKAKAQGSREMWQLVKGGMVSGVIALAQTGFEVVADHFPLWFNSGKVLYGVSIGCDPILIGAGYIIGIRAGLSLFFGMICGWVIGVPILSHYYGAALQPGNAEDLVMSLWSQHIRYMGVGAILIAGIWTILNLLKPMLKGLVVAYQAMQSARLGQGKIIRTEKDIPLQYLWWGLVVLLLAIFMIAVYAVRSHQLPVSMSMTVAISLISMLYILVFGLISTMVCGYMVGLIGSTNTPLSGLIILNVLALSLLLFPLIGLQADLSVLVNQQIVSAIIILLVAVISAVASITLENIQDLRAGQMIGATPWKQQTMMILGVVVSALVVPPIMQLLFQAYGIGGVYPHAGMNPSQMLSAPQANLIATLSQAFVNHNLPWPMIVAGMCIGIIAVIMDRYLQKRGYNLVILAVGLGIYLPPELTTALILGGCAQYFGKHKLHKKLNALPQARQAEVESTIVQRTMLLACGLVAGGALVGVILAIPFVLMGSSDALRLVGDNFAPIARILGIIAAIAVSIWLYRLTTRFKNV